MLYKEITARCYKDYSIKRYLGFSLVVLIVAIGIVALLAMTAQASYTRFLEKTKVNDAIKDIKIIALQISDFSLNNGFYPDSLTELQISKTDPWGNAYGYLGIAGKPQSGHRRKDHSMVPINSDFDLYSMGKDGRSRAPLTASMSRDDIVRGNNGNFVGLASEY